MDACHAGRGGVGLGDIAHEAGQEGGGCKGEGQGEGGGKR